MDTLTTNPTKRYFETKNKDVDIILDRYERIFLPASNTTSS
jgi:hypothetical protein